jgi:uncharacterized protein YdiU (UPF0061 family)
VTAIGDLRFTDRFVTSLPADPVRGDRRPRQVVGAGYSHVEPTAVAQPSLVALVPEVAALLDLDATTTPELVDVLAGNRVLPGMVPYAACYGGHQFGTWAGQLGDGRAITLAEVVNRAGETWEIQLKGAGPTPYSRRADGRAVMRSSLRELVCSEAMHHLGIPTTRALSLVATGEKVERDLLYDGHPAFEPGAVVCRVAPSFLRFGNYEIFAARDEIDTLRRLVDLTRVQFYPHTADVVALYAEVVERTAWLVAEWMRVGFVHGVMNTDNMSILGLTIDYGPYGWIEPFDLDWTPNITDASGRRYRFGNQPQIAHWNLAQLARAFAPLVDNPQRLVDELDRFPASFTGHHRQTSLRKLGLTGRDDTRRDDDDLLEGLGVLFAGAEIDMSLLFRSLADWTPDTDLHSAVRDAYYRDASSQHLTRLDDWARAYADRIRAESLDTAVRRERMNAVNPLYVPRNYLVQEVITATEAGDRDELATLLDVLRRPYADQPGRHRYAAKRPEWARHKPGCSMLSCSS